MDLQNYPTDFSLLSNEKAALETRSPCGPNFRGAAGLTELYTNIVFDMLPNGVVISRLFLASRFPSHQSAHCRSSFAYYSLSLASLSPQQCLPIPELALASSGSGSGIGVVLGVVLGAVLGAVLGVLLGMFLGMVLGMVLGMALEMLLDMLLEIISEAVSGPRNPSGNSSGMLRGVAHSKIFLY